MKKVLYAVGILVVLVVINQVFVAKPASTEYTKSGNCGGASVSTLRFAPEPSAKMFPEAIWFEQCPNGKYFQKIGDGQWNEITKKEADQGSDMLNLAGRKFAKIVD